MPWRITLYKGLMVVAALATIIGTVITFNSWKSDRQPAGSAKSTAENNSGGVNVSGTNSGTINYNTTTAPAPTADLFNPSMIYINPEAGRQFRCMMNNSRCDRVTRTSESATLTLQFGNDGTGAATDVQVQAFTQGVSHAFEKRFSRIAKDEMTKSVFAVVSSAAPRTSVCIEYSEESGARKWVVFAGKSSDGSGGVMTGLANFADFQKVDGGTITGTNASCSGRAQAALSG